jgi:hypothetical protein
VSCAGITDGSSLVRQQGQVKGAVCGRLLQLGQGKRPPILKHLPKRRIDRVLLGSGAERPGDVGEHVIIEVDHGSAHGAAP